MIGAVFEARFFFSVRQPDDCTSGVFLIQSGIEGVRMKKLLNAGVVVVIALIALVAHAEESTMITTDDLERKYPSAGEAENRAQTRQNERMRLENECPALKESVDAARTAAYDDTDPRPYADRAQQYYRLKSAYSSKCGGTTLF